MIKIKTQIEPHPITGLNQEVEIAQIAYMDFDIQEAKVKLRVYSIDENGNKIDSNATTYEIWETFTSSVILNQEGTHINETNFPKLEDETDEEYQIRFQTILEDGIDQFTFWVQHLVPIISQALAQGKHLLNLD